jgi:8-oxo-dGTP diphosphatase
MAKRKYTYEWPRPALTVDIALFTVEGTLQNLGLRVLLIQRGEPPFREAWALPGGFVREDEDLEAAALRELQEEAGVQEVHLEQVLAVGTPGRDPRGHTVTVLHVGLVAGDRYMLTPQGDAAAARWFDLNSETPVPRLAFDHAALLDRALSHLRRRLGENPGICYELLPERFTLSELQALTEAILGRAIDRRNFRRKIKDLNLVVETGGIRQQGRHRPAQLYRFDPKQLARLGVRERALPF